jgi:hypothetical protein
VTVMTVFRLFLDHDAIVIADLFGVRASAR